MHVVVVRWTVDPDRADWFAERLLRQASETLQLEPGCLRFDVCRAETAHEFLLYEIYTRPEDFAAHLKMPHFKSFSAEAEPVTRDKTVETFRLC